MSNIHTPICDQLGIRYPIFAFTPSAPVAAAVTRAGGMGFLGCVRFNEAEQLDEVQNQMRSLLMMHYDVRQRAADSLGQKETQAIIDEIIARLRARTGH